MNIRILLLGILLTPIIAMAADTPPPKVNRILSAEEQAALTPEDVIVIFKEGNERLTMNNIRLRSPIIAELEQAGEVKIVGAVYDMHTGAVHALD